MRSGAYIFICILCLLLFSRCGCNRDGQEIVPRLPIVTEVLSDENSPWYIDRSAYPTYRSLLPVGIYGTDESCLSMLETLLELDAFDNITGDEGADGIKDFAGEYFSLIYRRIIPDSVRIQTIRNLARLMQGDSACMPAKILLITSDTVSITAMEDIGRLVEDSKLGIKALSVLHEGNLYMQSLLEKAQETDKDKSGTIGVLAPGETILSGGYTSLSWNAYVAVQDFSPGITPSLDNPDYPIVNELIPAYFFNYSRAEITYRGSRYEPSFMQVLSTENKIRYCITSLVEQLRKGGRSPLKYLVLGEGSLVKYEGLIIESLNMLRNYRKDDQYVYRHLIEPIVEIIQPQKETAKLVYRILRDDCVAAFRATPCRIIINSNVPTDLTKYPLLNVCIDH
jgi:hypothetical protein